MIFRINAKSPEFSIFRQVWDFGLNDVFMVTLQKAKVNCWHLVLEFKTSLIMWN